MKHTHFNLTILTLLIGCLLLVGGVQAVTWTSASGCWTATDGAYTIVMWNATGTTTWTPPTSVTGVNYLVIGGGGGGGGNMGGGGGGGGFRNGSGYSVTPAIGISIVVGAGGVGGISGSTVGGYGGNSSFGNISATKGGGGGTYGATPQGTVGGSGGGGNGAVGSQIGSAGNLGGYTPVEGYAGGYGAAACGGGGGGSGAVGSNAVATTITGAGGIGTYNSITGTSIAYAGGGTGGLAVGQGSMAETPPGGGGAGGVNAVGSNGVNGLGGGAGGGGAGGGGGGTGGSGIVIIRYLTPAAPVASFTPSSVVTGISPLTVTFNDTSTNTPTYGNYTYQGYGSNTTLGYNFSTSLNTAATFTAGNFSISHGAGNAAGFNLSTQITWINVTNQIPIVSFTANVTSGVAPLIVQLNDTSTGNMTSRFWNFGDVTNSTAASPVKTYSTAGTYTVNLTETNLDVSNSTTKTINVYNPANSQFSSFNTAGTAPFSTYLYDLSTNTTPGTDTWYWMFGDGNTSTAQSLYYTWNITGTYAINHSFSNGVSTSWINKSAYIVVGTPTPPVVAPVASFYGGPQIGAPPLLVYLTDVSSNTPTSWNWSFGDGTYGITQNPSHWYNSSGFFTVGLTATNTAGSNTTSQNNFIMVY